MVLVGRVVNVLLVGVNMVNGFGFDRVLMRLVVFIVVMRVVWFFELIVFLMMFFEGYIGVLLILMVFFMFMLVMLLGVVMVGDVY